MGMARTESAKQVARKNFTVDRKRKKKFLKMGYECKRCEMCGTAIGSHTLAPKKWCMECVKEFAQEKATIKRHYETEKPQRPIRKEI